MKGLQKWSRKYHRWLGVAVAFPWIWLAVTGLILRQQEGWHLNTRQIHSKALLKHYGVWPSEEPIGYHVGGTKEQFVVLWGSGLYKDGNPLGEASSLRGAVASGPHLAVATESEIILYDAQLEYMDALDEITLEVAQIDELIAGNKEYPVYYRSGGALYGLKREYLEVRQVALGESPKMLELSRPAEVPAAMMKTIERFYADDVGITYARLILDLHSGNFFGPVGKAVIDLSAFLSIVLTLLGLLLLKKRKPNKRNDDKVPSRDL